MERKGWLLKQGLVLRKWHRRFCVVSPSENQIVYYLKEPQYGSKPRGRISLHNVAVKDGEDIVIGGKTFFVFVLEANNVKFFMACPSMQSKLSWIQVCRLTTDLMRHVSQSSRNDAGHGDVERSLHGTKESYYALEWTNIIEEATEKMISSVEELEVETRRRLAFITDDKWHLKKMLMQFRSSLSKVQLDVQESLELFRNEEFDLRKTLDDVNNRMSTIELFVRKSNRLQFEVIQCIERNRDLKYAIRNIQERYQSKDSNLFLESFLNRFRQHFFDENVKESVLMFEIYVSLEEFARLEHLPRLELLNRLKAERVMLWKDLVRAVNKRKSSRTSVDEIAVILQLIHSVLESKERVTDDFVCDLPEDVPHTYSNEWMAVRDLVSQLRELRCAERCTRDQLDLELHRRELLMAWKSS